jgi:chemotaxis-related protein WspB
MLFLLFQAGDAQYALEISRVIQILPRANLRPCPAVPDYIAGLLNFHGAPVVVVDLSRLLNGARSKRFMSTRIIVAEYKGTSGREIRLGLMAEGATTVIKKDHFEFIDNALKAPGVNYLGKMFRHGERLIQLVKVEEIVPAELEDMLIAPDKN